jgi:hypothetical protein
MIMAAAASCYSCCCCLLWLLLLLPIVLVAVHDGLGSFTRLCVGFAPQPVSAMQALTDAGLPQWFT